MNSAEGISKIARNRLKVFNKFVDFALTKRDYQHNFFPTDLVSFHLAVKPAPFSASEIREHWLAYADFLKRSKEKHLVQLYIGTPYCRSRCAYCIYFHGVGTPALLEKYKNDLLASLEYYSEVFKNIVFDTIYFGGGTPSLFSEAQLRQICSGLKKNVRYSRIGERSFELTPSSTTLGKLRIIAAAGFNRISFGVQSLNRDVLSAVSRIGQTEKMAEDAVKWAKAAGFRDINLDIMLGLPNDKNGNSLVESFRKALSFLPRSILMYPCRETPWYLNKCFRGDLNLFHSAIRLHKGRLREIAALAARSGFYSSDSSDVLDSRNADGIIFTNSRLSGKRTVEYQFAVPNRRASIFGLGHHSNSCISGTLHYHSTPLVSAPGRNRYSGFETDRRHEMAYFALQELSRGRTIHRGKFHNFFGIMPENAFPEAVILLKALRGISVCKKGLTLLPREPKAFFIHAMFFLPYGDVIKNLLKMSTESAIKYPASPPK